MNVAVLSLTRDRLEYTKHCFGTLQDHAGCEFDHLILDQGSVDGTQEWLRWEYPYSVLVEQPSNIGIHRGWNQLAKIALEFEPDVIVTFDNDCEIVTPNTLSALARAVYDTGWVLSPHIGGLRGKPSTLRHIRGVSETGLVGGICRAAPAELFRTGFRFDENQPIWGGDETTLATHAAGLGRVVGYLDGYHANHYETTDGQHERFPAYFERRVREGGPS
jgi:GT2 family glycosyltransferase